ncbi:MAG: TatD family hydrolase, partial [Mariprofundaceae bacterium]
MTDIRLVDTHCHVDFSHFDDDREETLERFRKAGGQWLVAVAVDLDNLPRLFALAEAHDDIFCSVGIHPNHEVEAEPTVEQLRELAGHRKCV